jgi:hypothetical protein
MGRLFGKMATNPSAPEVVADAIWTAVYDTSSRLRFRAGQDAETLLDRRKLEDDESFLGSIKALMR